ncbi:MAG TPA: pentapeptide repeat-containing protein [Candidatus Acidoferrum sp.]|nr:pentapeptide repeat-containing protein [Candidatus Acidoferrum sp.]
MIEAVVAVALRAILASVVLGAALAALVFAATRVLPLTAATRHALWTTALVAMAAMPLAGLAVSASRATRVPAVVTMAPTGSYHPLPPPHVSGRASHPSPPRTIDGVSHPAIAAASAASGFSFTPHLTRALALGVAGAWVLGALIGLIGLTASVVRVRGLKRRSSPLGAELADELPWLTEIGPGREIYLRLSYEIETPVAIGFRRPVILIPTELATAEGLTAIESLVLHEHAHLRRYDDWTNLVQRVIERLFWFNPLVWLVGRRIALEREIASDDAVVEKTGAPREYATSLWRLAREMRMPEHAVVAPGALLTRKQISVRIEQLLDGNRSRLRRSPAAALGVATAAALAVAFVATSSPAVELPARTSPRLIAAPPHTLGSTAQHQTTHPRLIIIAQDTPSPSPVPAPTAADAKAQSEALKAHAEALRQAATAASAASAAATAASATASESVQNAVHEALGSLPNEIAQGFDGGPGTHHDRLDGVKLSREIVASCSGCSMRGADARGLDLHGLRIGGDNLNGADMRGVNLAGARLLGTSLAGADLSNADLRNAELSGVDLRQTKLDGALLDGVKLVGVSLRTVSMRGTAMRAVLGNCVGCDFARIDLHGQDLHGITLHGNDLSHSDLHDANLSGASFSGVDLSHTNLAGADLTNARFDGCDLSHTDLRGARTTGMILRGSGLE